MRATPYLLFNGTCREAISFYAETLGLETPAFMTVSDMPPEDQAQMPEGTPAMAVMHTSLAHGDLLIFASDDVEAKPAGMAGASIHLTVGSAEEAHRVFAAFSEGGEVSMPIGEMFWTSAFGTLTDRFGIRWMISAPEKG